jgi:polyamine oxidase
MEGRKKVVVIIGAGSAGVGAARWLLDNDVHQSLEIVVLEARERVGGRIHTINDYDCPIDLGAAWLHDHGPQHPISIMCRQLNLTLRKSDDESGEVYDLNGQQYPDRQTERTWELLETVLTKSIKAVQGHSCEDLSLEDLIFQKVTPKQWEDPVFQSWFAMLDFDLGSPISQVSPAAICRDWVKAMDRDEDDIDMVFRDTGYVGIINALVSGEATKHPSMKPTYPSDSLTTEVTTQPMNILLNQCVESIALSPSSSAVSDHLPVTLSIRDTLTGSSHSIQADRVLVTVPLGVLKSNLIQFDPPLSQPKQEAIRTAGFGNVVKIVLEFEKIFWSSQTEFLSIADLSLCSPHPAHQTTAISDSERSPQLRGLCTHFWNVFPISGKKILICFGLGEAAGLIDQVCSISL